MLQYIFVTQTLEEMGLGLCVTVGVGRLKATRDFGYFLIKFSEIRKSEKCNLYHFTRRWRSNRCWSEGCLTATVIGFRTHFTYWHPNGMLGELCDADVAKPIHSVSLHDLWAFLTEQSQQAQVQHVHTFCSVELWVMRFPANQPFSPTYNATGQPQGQEKLVHT